MKELMGKLQELVDLFLVKLQNINTEKEGLRIKAEGLNIKATELDKREAIIKEGEIKYKKIGDIAAYGESAQSLMNQAKAEHATLIDKQAKFDIYKAKADEEILNEKILIDRRNKGIASEKAALEEDKKTYKKKITDEILKNIKK